MTETINRFKVVGRLLPSNTGKSFKVMLEGRFYGLVSLVALRRSLSSRPLLEVEICKFDDSPRPRKTEQTELCFLAELQP